MAAANDIDQDALAAEWGMALEEQGATGTDAAEDWATLGEDGIAHAGAAKGGAERILNQEEIDNLLGFSVEDLAL
uniref:hypothetical protein n=2 Tax=Klebsiella pneumoniae TaxID=573 RepID=UPI003D6D9003